MSSWISCSQLLATLTTRKATDGVKPALSLSRLTIVSGRHAHITIVLACGPNASYRLARLLGVCVGSDGVWKVESQF